LAANDTEAMIINMSSAATVGQKGIRVIMPTQTAGAFPNPDCYIAFTNGQNPGSLSNFVSGFYSVVQSGADNYSFISEHSAGVTTSSHFVGSNAIGATSDFAYFTSNALLKFKVDYLGNASANSFIKLGGTSSQFLKADGSIDSNTYAIDSNVVHKTGDEVIDGVKSFNSTPKFNSSEIKLLDVANSNYASITVQDNGFNFKNYLGNNQFYIEGGVGFAAYKTPTIAATFSLTSLTASRIYTMPNASGTLALTSNIPASLTLITTGTSGAATLVGRNLNIPQYQGGLSGTQYVYVSANGTDVQNATELRAAYNTAKTMSPSVTKRITVIAAPGNYNFELNEFVMDTQYIDLVSLDANKSIIFNSASSSGTISITANDVFVKGVDVATKVFTIATNLNLLKVENCKGGNNSYGQGLIVSGTFTNCIGGLQSFGTAGTASGTFTDCIGGSFSFAGSGIASGIFTNCTGTGGSFGASFYASLTGTCVSCTSDLYGQISGKLYFCRQTTNGNALPIIATNSAGRIVAFITKDNNFIAQQP